MMIDIILYSSCIEIISSLYKNYGIYFSTSRDSVVQGISDFSDLASGAEDTVQHIASIDIMRSKILIIMNVFIVIVFQRHKLNSIFGCELNKAIKRVYSIS